jgi:hypothetical protein
MSDERPQIHTLFPRSPYETDAQHWCNGILGRQAPLNGSCYLGRLIHCKAKLTPGHEFLLAYMTFYDGNDSYESCCIIDRCPAENVEQAAATPKNTSESSLISSPSANSLQSHFPYSSERNRAILWGGGAVPARDRVTVPTLGKADELDILAKTKFGAYEILNTLSVDSDRGHVKMSAPELATAVEVVHNMAPDYTLRKHQCYWFALLLFLLVRSRTKGAESNSKVIVKRGKLWGVAPPHCADDDQLVAEEEYENAWLNFKVRYHIFTAQMTSGC